MAYTVIDVACTGTFNWTHAIVLLVAGCVTVAAGVADANDRLAQSESLNRIWIEYNSPPVETAWQTICGDNAVNWSGRYMRGFDLILSVDFKRRLKMDKR